MKLGEYKKIKKKLFFLMFISLVYAVSFGNVFVALAGLVGYLIITSFISIKVDGESMDERELGVAGRSAVLAFRLLMPMMGISSLMMVIGGRGQYYYVRGLGIVLSYITCLGLVLYILAYKYYDAKSGGIDDKK